MGRRHLLRSGYLTNELGMGGLGVDAYKVAWSSTEGWTKEILKLRNWRRWTSEGKRRSSGSRICVLSMGSSVCHLSGFLSVELQVSFLASQSIWKLLMCRISAPFGWDSLTYQGINLRYFWSQNPALSFLLILPSWRQEYVCWALASYARSCFSLEKMTLVIKRTCTISYKPYALCFKTSISFMHDSLTHP